MQMLMAMLINSAEYVGSPIAGPPTNVDTYIYSGSKIGFDWTIGDNDAQVQVSRDGGSTTYATYAARTANWDSGQTQVAWDAAGYVFSVRHIDGIYTSAWVDYDGGF